jgi:hypothetical protein
MMKSFISLSAVLALALAATGCGKVCTADETTSCTNKHNSCVTACGDGTSPNYSTCIQTCSKNLCDCQDACGTTCDSSNL